MCREFLECSFTMNDDQCFIELDKADASSVTANRELLLLRQAEYLQQLTAFRTLRESRLSKLATLFVY